MGTFTARPDGLYSLDYGDGSRPIPLALSEAQLRAAGHQPAPQGGPAPGMTAPIPSYAVAGPGGAPDGFVNPYTTPQPETYADKYVPPVATPAPAAPAPAAAGPTPGGFGGIKRGKGVGIGDLGTYLQTHTITGAPVEKKPTFQGAPADDTKYKDIPHESTDVTRRGGEKTQVAPSELVSYEPPSGGTGGDASPAPKRTGGGGGGGSKIPKDQVLPGLKGEIQNDQRPENYLDAAFRNYEDRSIDRLNREEELQRRQKDLDAERLQRAAVDEEIRRKMTVAQQREAEADRVKPQSAKEIWSDRSTASQIGAALMVGLGGFAQGFSGGRVGNTALEMVQRGIQDEVDYQRNRYENAVAKGRRAENDYERAIAIYGTPEAAALDLKIRSYALADTLNKTRAEQIGTQEALDNAIGISQGLRIEREKAKQELYELERMKALRAAQAAGSGGQAAELAKQGIVKIGKDFYTVDKKTGQWVPLDKAAELAGKSRGGPTAQKADSVVATIDVIGNRIGKKDQKAEVFDPENQNIITKGVRSAVNAVAGERTILPGSEKQRAEAAEFNQIRNDLMAQTSVINGQGAMSDPEAKRASEAIGTARTWGELQRAQKYLRDKAAAAASAYDGEEPAAAR